MSVSDTLKDAAYVTIGVGVLGFQKAQVRRQELLKQLKEQRGALEAQVADGRRSLNAFATQLEQVVAPVRSQVEAGIDTAQTNLPAAVQDALKQARTALRTQEQAVRKSLGLTSAA